MTTKPYTATEMRAELTKIMPGYNWTVHKSASKHSHRMEATGTQSSGFNRLSTLSVTRTTYQGVLEYEVKSAGYGLRAHWLHKANGRSLAKALRNLQDHYEAMASMYHSHAASMQQGRIEPTTTTETPAPEPDHDCQTNHLCQGQWVHLPTGELCSKCGAGAQS